MNISNNNFPPKKRKMKKKKEKEKKKKTLSDEWWCSHLILGLIEEIGKQREGDTPTRKHFRFNSACTRWRVVGSKANSNRELNGKRLKFVFRFNSEENLHFILGLLEKSNNGGGRLFDLQTSGSDGLHGHGSVLCRHSLCSCFDTSSTTSSFSSSLYDSTVPVRLHFHCRLSRRLRSNPSGKLQLTVFR